MNDTKKILPSSFVKLSYTVYDEEGNELFSTSMKTREGETIDKPVIIKVGEKEVFFEDVLIGKSEGEEFEEVLPPEKAFGQRDPKKIFNIPLRKLRAITGRKDFHVGDELYTQNNEYYGRIVMVGSRGVVIDQNHPLAGKTLKLKVKVHKIVNPEDPDNEKVEILMEKYFGEYSEKMTTELKANELIIRIPADQTSLLDSSTLVRYIYVPRKIFASEIMRETNIKKVTYIDEFKLEAEQPVTPSTPKVETSTVAEAIKEITEETQEESGEEAKQEKSEEK